MYTKRGSDSGPNPRQASLLYLVARYLGYDAHRYDGSFEEWSRRPKLPAVKWPDLKSDVKSDKPWRESC